MSSHFSVRFTQSRQEEKRITLEEYDDVKRACHYWLLKHCPGYRREQEETPEKKRMQAWDNEDDWLKIKEKRKRKK